MKLEDAFYYKSLLSLGFYDEYNEWLNELLEKESSLSDIVLDLSCCGSDYNKAISLLHNYCGYQEFDEANTCDRLRLYFRDAYYSKGWSKKKVVSTMYHLTISVGHPKDLDPRI